MHEHRWETPVTRVVHVVESYGGGVAAAISDYVTATPDLEHALLFADRPEAHIDTDADEVFLWRRPLPEGHLRRIASLVRLLRGTEPGTLVHAHSSLAGVYLRSALPFARRVRTAYTPHCYGFERQDLPPWATGAIYGVEKLLTHSARSTVVAACCPRELELARQLRRRAPALLVPNVAPAGAVRPLRRPPQGAMVLAGAGRLSTQKDPAYFTAAIDALTESGVDVTARWLGGGTPAARDQLEQRGVEVTGWLGRKDFLRELGSADVYLHSAAWEGFPITILEAVSAGVPTLVRSVPSMRPYAFPHALEEPADLVKALASLEDQHAWDEIEAHHQALLELFSRSHQIEALASLYS